MQNKYEVKVRFKLNKIYNFVPKTEVTDNTV